MTKPAKLLTLISLVAAAQVAASAASQTITFDAIPNQIFGVSPFVAVAQASSGLPVTFASTTPAICKTAGSLVTLLAAGPCFITASQAGNGTYTAAPSVTQSFTVNPAVPAGGYGFFYNPAMLGTGVIPVALVVGDFNGDGIPDVATANNRTNNVSILLNNGAGKLTPTAINPSVGKAPWSIAAGDFNADGKLDLVVANSADNTVTVLIGDGAGAFTPATGSPFPVGTAPYSVVVGDFNGDGIQDLATANVNSSNVTILLGNGSGGFFAAPAGPVTVGANPTNLVVADFNGDGIQDLAVANGNGTVLIGNGDGSFTVAPGSPFGLSRGATTFAVGDFNGDGIPDLAASTPTNNVSVLLGNGLGGFTEAAGSPYQVGSVSGSPQGTFTVTVGDFNGDGIPDIAAGAPYANTVATLVGNGVGGFTVYTRLSAVYYLNPALLATGDFDGDGREDLVVASVTSNYVAILPTVVQVTGSLLTTTSPSAINPGQSVPLVVAVGDGVAFVPLTGTVTVFDGTTAIGTASQNAGSYSFTVTGLSAGSHTLSAAYSGDARTTASTSNAITIQVVVPLSQSITFNTLPDVLFNPATIALTATASSGLTVSYASGTLGVCTVSGVSIKLIGLGSCSITASQAGNVYYTAAPNVTQSFNVTQGTQTISFDAVPNQIFGVSPFPVSVQATSRLQLTIVSNTTGVCKVASTLVTLIGPGSCSITASQSGNVNYFAASSVTRSFNVRLGTVSALAKPSGGLSLVPGTSLPYDYPAVGDLNADGIPDLVSAGGQGYLGNGTGSFALVPSSGGIASCCAVIPMLGDFNGDGIPDMVSVGSSVSTLNVLLGTGGGRFVPVSGSPITVASTITSLALGDFNGDGIQDIAALTPSPPTVTVLLGNGTGGFTPVSGGPFSLGSTYLNPATIAIGDFNGDGIADIVSANTAGKSVSLLIGDGSGAFTLAAGSPFSAGPGLLSIGVGDFNGDGFQDVAIATGNLGGAVSVLLGNGSGGFGPPAQFATGNSTSPQSLAIADFNGDGTEDLAVAALGSGQVTVLLGDGLGNFTQSAGPPLSVPGANSVIAADFNGDGIQDLAASGNTGTMVFLGGPAPTGSVLSTTSPAIIDVGQSVPFIATVSDAITYNPPVFTPPTIPAVPPTATSTAFNAPTGTITILDGTTVIGTSTQTASPYSFIANGLSAGTHTLIANYSGDPRSLSSASNTITIQVVAPLSQSIAFNALPDIPYTPVPISLIATASSGLTVTFAVTTPGVCTLSGATLTIQALGMCSIAASQAGNVYYTAAPTVTQSFTVNQATQTIAFDAIPNQLFGISPFVIAAEANSGLGVFLASTTPSVCSTASNLVTLVKPGTCSITASQSGNVDYSAATAATRTFLVSRSTLAISYTPGPNSPVMVYNPDVIAVGDFNGDGIPDVVTAVEGGFQKIAVFLGDGKGGFTPAPGGQVSVGSVPYTLAVGDFNGDGFQDIAVGNNSDGNITVLLGNGSGGFYPAIGSPIALTGRPYAMVVGDFNGDGIQDLAVSNAVPDSITVLLGNGSGGFTPAPGGPISGISYLAGALVAGDFNGDGIQDLAAADYTSGTITVMLGNGSGGFTVTTGPVLSTGAILTSLAVGDFNRDGIQDLAVVNNASNTVIVLLGNGLGAFSPSTSDPYTVPSGAWSLVAADFNGDGIPDLAVSSRTANNVTLLLGDGHGGFTTSAAGPLAAGSSPVFLAAADFNGDGIEDIVTANFSSGNLSVFLGQPIGTTPQTITFAPLPNVPVTTAPFALTATADSGLTVAFTSTTPTVCSVSGATLTILIAGNCSITATQPGSTIYAAATPVTQSFTVLFADVAPTDNDYAAINAMTQHGITSGCGTNNFCPNQNVTRDQMAIFIVRAIYGSDNFTYTTTPYFTDVTPTTFGFRWIQKLKDLGITGGCTATTYCPGNVVTRDQMAIFIIRARLGLNLAGPTPTFTYPSTPYFTDATAANEFAFPWIQRMRLDSITSGCTATTYCSSAPVTRGEMAIFIMRGAFNQFLPAGTPIVTQVSPSTIASGTSGTYTITGVNTNFVQGVTQLSPIPGLTQANLTVTSPTTMTVQLTDAGGVPTQPNSLLVITGSEQAVLPNGLQLQ